MTIREILQKYCNIEIELLLPHVLKQPKEFVFMNGDYKLTPIQGDRVARMAKRRMQGEPMAYILGYKDFYGLRFAVNKDVLIPRPETEWVVERVVQALGLPRLKSESDFVEPAKGLHYTSNSLRILDIGTGSGCIAISLEKGLGPRAKGGEFFAADVSKKALAVARQNAKNLKAKVTFIQSDLLSKIKFNPDILIANLPYGWRGVKNRFSSVKDGLKFEPQQALYTKEKGLYEIRRLLEQVKKKIIPPKLLYLEFDPRQKIYLHRLIKKYLPHGKVTFYKDLNNFWRYAEIVNKDNH